MSRQVALVAGLVIFVLSLAELVRPGLLPVPGDSSLLTVLGVVALLYAVSVTVVRRRTGPEYAETPDVELATQTRVPGDDLDEILRGFPGTGTVTGATASRLNRLRRVAVAVLTRYRGLDLATARRQVAEGTWTDDGAAGYLAVQSQSPSLGRRLRSVVSPGSGQQRTLDRAVDAVAAVAGVEADRPEPDRPREGVATGTRHLSDRPGWRQTRHWAGVSAVVLTLLAVGLLTEEPGVLLASVVAVGYAAYARVRPRATVDLSVTRQVSDREPDPGDDITVTVTVTNNGPFRPDLRIVDGVPESLAVTDGSPRRGVRLPEGGSVTLSYTVRARRGSHEFGPTQVLARSLSNATERERLLGPETTLTVVAPPRPLQAPVPLRQQPTQYAGRVSTDTGGDGVEFHTVREYKPGDSMTRIDWNRRARTGELTTLEFRRERATRVVLLVDVRATARAGHDPDGPDAVERAVAATERLFLTLLADGHQVGIAAFGPCESFLSPDTGPSHRRRGRELLTGPAFNRAGDDEVEHTWGLRFRRRLPDNSQVLVCSPLLDHRVGRVVRALEAYGHPVTVLSPDPTATGTPGRRLARVRRRMLVAELREAGVPVLDWAPAASLEEQLRRRAKR